MKKTARSGDAFKHPHFDHLATLGALNRRVSNPATREEALAELDRYWDEGLIRQKYGREKPVAKKTRAHSQPPVFTGQGILFAVIDDREGMRSGRVTTVDVITEAIEAALDAGKETSEEIARYITTSAFQHVTDRRVRFNSVLKASDAVGAQLTRKLYNAYNELEELADEEEDPRKKAEIKAEARGFAEALNVVISPFSCEYPGDPRLVNWDEVDRITDAFIKEQRLVRRERKGNPQ
ncbi:hypothetical protein SEA_MORRIGAN_45 [Microbacterium phage Morrigan]|nr:hypothetical protein SEA_MORRIGAN_45 [Microbacterium phage Morrigan]